MTNDSNRRPDLWRPHYYKLVGRLPVPMDDRDIKRWAWELGGNRHVAHDWVDGAIVSTVFLGIDHNFNAIYEGDTEALPILFETMIFPCEVWNFYQTRCATWEEAEAMHKVAVEVVKKTQRQLPVPLTKSVTALD